MPESSLTCYIHLPSNNIPSPNHFEWLNRVSKQQQLVYRGVCSLINTKTHSHAHPAEHTRTYTQIAPISAYEADDIVVVGGVDDDG